MSFFYIQSINNNARKKDGQISDNRCSGTKKPLVCVLCGAYRTPIENYKNLSKMRCLHYKIGFKFDIITAVLILHVCTRVRYLNILNGNTTEGNLPEFVSRGAHVYHPLRWCIVVIRSLSDFPLAN